MSGGNNQGEPAVALFMIIALVSGLCWLLWHYWQFFLMDHFFRWLRYGEVWIVNLLSGGHKYSGCLDWLRYANLAGQQPNPMILNATGSCFTPTFLAQVPPGEVANYYVLSMPPLLALGAMVTGYYRWPAAVILAVIVARQILFSPNNKFRTRHTLESFIAVQAKMWPIISPIVKFNPSSNGRIVGDTIPDKLPLFGEALSPEEWIAWNRIPVVNGIPDREATRRAFVKQLGPRWNGPTSLPLHMQALYAAFALKGVQKRDECDQLLGRLALAWSPEKGFRMDAELAGEVAKIIRDPNIGGKALPIADKYAWRATALLAVLKWARSNGGVLAPAAFLWLRAEDRALWYPLNNLGRRAYHSEGAGAMGHFMAEEAAQKPLPIPRVETAIVTLNSYLHDPQKRPSAIPPREGDVKA